MSDLFIHYVPRNVALQAGLKFYFNVNPCAKGHICNRYVINCTCVTCEAIYLLKKSKEKRERLREKESAEALRNSHHSKILHFINRDDAILHGLLKYFTGRPCSRGHVAERYVTGFSCLDCSKEGISKGKIAKKEYDKKWRAENGWKYIESGKAWVANNKEKVRQIKKEWADRNPESSVATAATRRARIKSVGGKISHKEIKSLLIKQKGKCANCLITLKKSGKNRYHVDHVTPIALGGANDILNIQLLCPPCNLRKSAKDPIQWANENGKLL